jgi:hypothetical protein
MRFQVVRTLAVDLSIAGGFGSPDATRTMSEAMSTALHAYLARHCTELPKMNCREQFWRAWS